MQFFVALRACQEESFGKVCWGFKETQRECELLQFRSPDNNLMEITLTSSVCSTCQRHEVDLPRTLDGGIFFSISFQIIQNNILRLFKVPSALY